jgi:hypothetical protein
VQPCDEDVYYFSPSPSNGASVKLNWQGKMEVLGVKPVPVSLCPPQIAHGLNRDRTRASAVEWNWQWKMEVLGVKPVPGSLRPPQIPHGLNGDRPRASTVEWNWQRKTKVLGVKPVPVSLRPPQIPHGLNRDRTWVSAVGGQRLTAWAIARPARSFNYEMSPARLPGVTVCGQ